MILIWGKEKQTGLSDSVTRSLGMKTDLILSFTKLFRGIQEVQRDTIKHLDSNEIGSVLWQS